MVETRLDAAETGQAPSLQTEGEPPSGYETKVFSPAANADRTWREGLTIQSMERKIFWISFTVLGLAADFVLPLWWALGATIPIAYISWWMAYRSGWFE